MTTKNLKIFDELNSQYFKLKKEEMEQGFADKHKKESDDQALKDTGHARAIIGGEPREPRIVEEAPPPASTKAKKPKEKIIEKVEIIKEEEKPVIIEDPKEAEIAALKAKLAELEKE